MNIAEIDKKTWQSTAGLGALLASVCAGWLIWVLSDGNVVAVGAAGLLAAVIVGLLTVLVGSVNLKLNHMRQKIRESHISLREMINIRPLLNAPPLDYGNWAVDPYFAKILAQLIYRHEPNHIVECGSGTSTVFMAHVQKGVTQTGRVTALENDLLYAEKSRHLLRDHKLTERAEVVHAPLQDWEVDGVTRSWYGVNLERFSGQSIDMLVVDGPPQSIGPLARYPAVLLLKPYLSDDCIIVLDDGGRSDEQETARRWAKLLDSDVANLGGPKGTIKLHSGSRK